MAFYAGEKLKASAVGQLSTTAQYQASVDQTITTSTVTFVAFGTANITSSLVTRAASGSGHTFTVNASGLWIITSSIRYAALATGNREAWIAAPAGRLANAGVPGSAGGFASLLLSWCGWLDAGNAYAIGTYQDSGSNATLTHDTLNALGRIDFAYILGEG
jgi:hypothetical protein